MTPFLLFQYMAAFAAGLLLNGFVIICLRIFYFWWFPVDRPKRTS